VNEPNRAAQKAAQKRRQHQHDHAYWEALRERAHALRAEGKTHEQIAAELGTAHSTISRWLRRPVVSEHIARSQRIGQLVRTGWSSKAIAAALNLSIWRVNKIRADLCKASPDSPDPVAGLAVDPDLPVAVLGRAARRARIVALSHQGLNNCQIARHMNITPSAVFQMLKRARREKHAADG